MGSGRVGPQFGPQGPQFELHQMYTSEGPKGGAEVAGIVVRRSARTRHSEGQMDRSRRDLAIGGLLGGARPSIFLECIKPVSGGRDHLLHLIREPSLSVEGKRGGGGSRP